MSTDVTGKFEHFEHLVRELQALAGDAAEGQADLCSRFQDISRAVSEAGSPAEALLERGLLVSQALSVAIRAHGSQCHSPTCCVDAVLRYVNQLLALPSAGLSMPWESAMSSRSFSSPKSDLPRRVKSFIDHRYAEPQSLKAIASALNCHPRHASRVFKKTFAMDLWDYLFQVRVTRAIELLTETDIKVEVVALLVGFRAKTTLFRAVRELTGLTPFQLRNGGRRNVHQ